MLVQTNDPKKTAEAAKKTQRYLCDLFEFESSPPRYVNIYTPDGGVLRASTEADAQRICAELNALLDRLEKIKELLPDLHGAAMSDVRTEIDRLLA